MPRAREHRDVRKRAHRPGAQDGEDRLGAEDAGHPLLAPITMVHRFYALAEAAARALGRDPDRPRNLRKITETR